MIERSIGLLVRISTVASFVVVASSLALTGTLTGCSSSESGPTKLGGGGGGGSGEDASGGFGTDDAFTLEAAPTMEASADAFFADDPPPKVCGMGGVTPVVPGGTPECPDDKNRQGCPCAKAGDEASCWPGLRKNRNRGTCHDGKTVCSRVSEVSLKWGPCVGYTLPTSTTGKGACTCFSGGEWKLDNLSPCFWNGAGGITGTTSTTFAAGKASCPGTYATPAEAWTHTTLNADCAGHFKLCYTLRAGDVKAPKDTDCILTTQCADGDYKVPNVVQPWGDLPGWKSDDVSCATQFNKSGGYGEMSVEGTSVECDNIKKVFLRNGYCPSICQTDPTAPGCAGCKTGGGGSF
ncbi:MAG: hypothetical protein NVSMB1_07600 [Polyangiales bacterium]